MGIAALALDRYADNTYSVTGKEDYTGVDETSESFGSHLSEASEKKCPYNFLAKDGIINYNGVIFECDYQQNAITLGNMYEKEKSKPIEDTAEENETPDAEKEPEIKENSLIEQINTYKTELYHKILNNETEVKIQIGNQEFTEKEWDKLMERIDKDLDDIQEALKEKEEKQAEEEYEDKIQRLFDERKELA